MPFLLLFCPKLLWESCSINFENYSIHWDDIEGHRWGFQNFNRQSQYIIMCCSQFPYLPSSDTSELLLPSQEQPVTLHTKLVSSGCYFVMRIGRKVGYIFYILTNVHINALLWRSDKTLLEIIVILLFHNSVSTCSFLINIIHLVCKYGC